MQHERALAPMNFDGTCVAACLVELKPYILFIGLTVKQKKQLEVTALKE